MSKQVWIVFTKSEPLDGCDIDMDGCDYYCAEAYVPVDSSETHTASLESLVNQVKQELLDKRLTLVDIPKCLRYNESEWDSDSDMEKSAHLLAAKALSSGAIKFSSFRPEEIEDLCRYRHKMYEINI